MTDVNRVMVFKSIDARKQNSNNNPGNCTVKFIPELILDENKQEQAALPCVGSPFDDRELAEYDNNKLVISKDKRKTWETITFPTGIYDYKYINEFLHKRIGKTGEEFGISVLLDLTTFKVFIRLQGNHQIDFANSGNFGVLLGFNKKVLTSSAYGENFPNISNSVDNLYFRSSLLSDSIIFGKRSNVLYAFSTSTKTRSLPFKITPMNYLWSKINKKKTFPR